MNEGRKRGERYVKMRRAWKNRVEGGRRRMRINEGDKIK